MARGRPATPPGTWGEISATQLDTGRWRAHLRVRLLNGQTRQIRKHGKSKTEAIRRVKEAAAAATTTRDSDTLTTTSTITALVGFYLDHLDAAEGTVKTYRSAHRTHIAPGIGELRLNEASTSTIDAHLQGLSPGSRKTCRALLSGAFGLAVRYDLVGHNPVRDTAAVPAQRTAEDVRAMTDAELITFRRMVRWFTVAPGPGRRPRAEPLPHLVDFLLGTGARVSDALRVQWDDIDTTGDVPRVTIHDVKKRGRARVLEMADVAANAVEAQRAATGEVFPWVFPTSTGRPLSVSNAERWIRGARKMWDDRPPEQRHEDDADVTWAGFHALRKTVATRIEDRVSLTAASQQLGHSDTLVTQRHYIQRPKQGPEVAEALNTALGGAL